MKKKENILIEENENLKDSVNYNLSEQDQTREQWNKIAEGYDRTNTPSQMWIANESLRLANLKPGMKFLDVASGSGALSIPAARLGANVTAVDLSNKMIELLKTRAKKEGLSNIETLVMDGNNLELEDNTFDMTASQFGVMLFPDMPRGIREMARVTKPGGTVLMNVYGDPSKIDFLQFFVNSIRVVMPEFNGPPTDPPPLPFQLQDPGTLHLEFVKAGLSNIIVKTVTEKTEFSSGEQLWDWLINSNPIVEHILQELNLEDKEVSIVKHELNRMIKERSENNRPAVLSNPINIGIGKK